MRERNFHLFITIYWLYRIVRIYKKARTTVLERKKIIKKTAQIRARQRVWVKPFSRKACGGQGVIDKVKSINNSTNRQLKILGILFNKIQRTVVAQEIVSEVKNRYGNFVFDTTVPFCPAQAEQAILEDKMSSDKSTLGRAFISIADEIIERK